MELLNFPNTKTAPFMPTSPKTANYNCIAWACGDDTKWYWPENNYFWPDDIPFNTELESFIQLFKKIGYEQCRNEDLEEEFEKIAIYTDINNEPQHAARQLISGLWTSKLGISVDVSHTLFAMAGGYYGDAKVFMKRKRLIKQD